MNLFLAQFSPEKRVGILYFGMKMPLLHEKAGVVHTQLTPAYIIGRFLIR